MLNRKPCQTCGTFICVEIRSLQNSQGKVCIVVVVNFIRIWFPQILRTSAPIFLSPFVSHADVVAGVGRAFIRSVRVCVCVRVRVCVCVCLFSTPKQNPLDISSPNVEGG